MPARSVFEELYPRAPSAHLDWLGKRSDELFARFAINPGNRRNFMLAQMGHESGGLTVFSEGLNYRAERLMEVWPSRFPTLAAARPFAGNEEKLANQVYAGRMGNGPPESGDGFRFRGRGYIQLTGRDAYRDVGKLAGLDLVGAPDLAMNPENALLVTCGFWKWKGLNEICDTGDYAAATRRINGGLVGFADRKAWLDKVLRVFADPGAREAAIGPAEAIAVQQALQRAGFPEVGAADGVVGVRTLAAIARYRQKVGLPAGGIDKALKQSLGVA
jgi:putative chitinase